MDASVTTSSDEKGGLPLRPWWARWLRLRTVVRWHDAGPRYGRWQGQRWLREGERLVIGGESVEGGRSAYLEVQANGPLEAYGLARGWSLRQCWMVRACAGWLVAAWIVPPLVGVVTGWSWRGIQPWVYGWLIGWLLLNWWRAEGKRR